MNVKIRCSTVAMACVVTSALSVTAVQAKNNKRPNFIIILTDDQGYEDLGCYGSPLIKTPRIDQMAAEGMKFSSFYAQTFSGPSRQALMTGSYPARVARQDNKYESRGDNHTSLTEITIAEVLKTQGYDCCMVGKWDLSGHSAKSNDLGLGPEHQGFDQAYWSTDGRQPFFEGGAVADATADPALLTSRFTDYAIDFLEQERDAPFFLYLAHTMPHTPLAASPQFLGTSERGLYGDCIEEIDYNVGRILDKLKELGVDEETYVVFTSDNGPWWIQGDDGGSALPLRGAKTSAWDGAFRVPAIIRAPGSIEAGRECDLVISTMDLLPTFATLAGAEIPTERTIDGVDISKVLSGEESLLERTFFYHQHLDLRAVRKGKWKLHIPHEDFNRNPTVNYSAFLKHSAPEDQVFFEEYALFNLEEDIDEKHNVAAQYPEVVEELKRELEWAAKDICTYRDGRGVNTRCE